MASATFLTTTFPTDTNRLAFRTHLLVALTKASQAIIPTKSPIRIREPVWIVIRVPVAIEVRTCTAFGGDGIDRQKPSQERIVVALLHIAQPRRSITHMQIGRHHVCTPVTN